MRIAIISDIHGNLPALDAVLANVKGDRPDQVVCLGDVGAMGPFPRETLERVQALECPVVMGNGDATMLDPPDETSNEENTRRVEEMDQWCAEQLGAEHLGFIRSFQQTVEIPLGVDQTLLCYHGSPRSYNDVISATTPDDEIEPMLAGCRATIMAGGHWHFQMLRRYRHMILLNPGSVGLPYDFTPDGEPYVPSRAEYGMITSDDDKLRLEHRRVSYDSNATISAMHERGMPHANWWASRWRQPTNSGFGGVGYR